MRVLASRADRPFPEYGAGVVAPSTRCRGYILRPPIEPEIDEDVRALERAWRVQFTDA